MVLRSIDMIAKQQFIITHRAGAPRHCPIALALLAIICETLVILLIIIIITSPPTLPILCIQLCLRPWHRQYTLGGSIEPPEPPRRACRHINHRSSKIEGGNIEPITQHRTDIPTIHHRLLSTTTLHSYNVRRSMRSIIYGRMYTRPYT